MQTPPWRCAIVAYTRTRRSRVWRLPRLLLPPAVADDRAALACVRWDGDATRVGSARRAGGVRLPAARRATPATRFLGRRRPSDATAGAAAASANASGAAAAR